MFPEIFDDSGKWLRRIVERFAPIPASKSVHGSASWEGFAALISGKRIQFGKTARSSRPMESHFEEGNAGLASPHSLLNFSRGSSEGESQQARTEQRYSRRC
jgi:hypothetical protein